MNVDFLADTNILISILEGDKRLLPYLDKLLAVSFVSEIELLGKPAITEKEIKSCRALLNDCIILPYSEDIKELAIGIKQKRKITLVDAMIAATGTKYKFPILTFDKGFSKIQAINLLLLE